MGSLSPELKEVSDSFSNAYAEGGIEACRDLVANLQQESELIKAAAEGVNSIDNDTVILASVLPPEETYDRLKFTEGIIKDTRRALSRYSFALFLLNVIEPENSED